jgi:hypothetical protein
MAQLLPDSGCKSHLDKIASWMRRRLRMCLWKQWKQGKTKHRKLRGLGIPENEARKNGLFKEGLVGILKYLTNKQGPGQ